MSRSVPNDAATRGRIAAASSTKRDSALFEFPPESDLRGGKLGRGQRKLKQAVRYADDRGRSCRTGEGVECPRCGATCAYGERRCPDCHLALAYADGVGAVVLRERKDILKSNVYAAAPRKARGLPEGWTTRYIPRPNSRNAMDKHYFSPDLKFEFVSRKEARLFLERVDKMKRREGLARPELSAMEALLDREGSELPASGTGAVGERNRETMAAASRNADGGGEGSDDGDSAGTDDDWGANGDDANLSSSGGSARPRGAAGSNGGVGEERPRARTGTLRTPTPKDRPRSVPGRTEATANRDNHDSELLFPTPSRGGEGPSLRETTERLDAILGRLTLGEPVGADDLHGLEQIARNLARVSRRGEPRSQPALRGRPRDRISSETATTSDFVGMCRGCFRDIEDCACFEGSVGSNTPRGSDADVVPPAVFVIASAAGAEVQAGGGLAGAVPSDETSREAARADGSDAAATKPTVSATSGRRNAKENRRSITQKRRPALKNISGNRNRTNSAASKPSRNDNRNARMIRSRSAAGKKGGGFDIFRDSSGLV